MGWANRFERDGLICALQSLPQAPEWRIMAAIAGCECDSIIWAGGHAFSASGAGIGNNQGTVMIPADGIGWADLNAFCANPALPAAIGDIHAIELDSAGMQARAAVASCTGIGAEFASFHAQLRITNQDMPSA